MISMPVYQHPLITTASRITSLHSEQKKSGSSLGNATKHSTGKPRGPDMAATRSGSSVSVKNGEDFSYVYREMHATHAVPSSGTSSVIKYEVCTADSNSQISTAFRVH
jgi:hypothetical protein